MKIFKSLESFGGGHFKLLVYIEALQKTRNSLYGDMKHHYRKRFAFTLAEVLITLGIIGIVAAMTMPVLIAKYRSKFGRLSLRSGILKYLRCLFN